MAIPSRPHPDGQQFIGLPVVSSDDAWQVCIKSFTTVNEKTNNNNAWYTCEERALDYQIHVYTNSKTTTMYFDHLLHCPSITIMFSSMQVSQTRPVMPTGQLQTKSWPSSVSEQVPPLWHGTMEHGVTHSPSTIMKSHVSQVGPEKTSGHWHRKLSVCSTHIPSFIHGSLSQKTTFSRQRLPVNPGWHVQTISSPELSQVPLFSQGESTMHSLTARQKGSFKNPWKTLHELTRQVRN